jgi:predicted nucleotidyltransferase
LTSVTIKSIDRNKIRGAATAYAAHLRREHPEIKRIIWFGSWINGLPSPGSDVDICLVVSSSEKPFQDRISDYLPTRFPVGIDLFVYTSTELERLWESSPGWYKAITSGVDV